MGMYGVEEEFWVGDYRFEVNFSHDYAGGLCQRDLWMAQRKPLEDLALADFTGPQLLGAYDGPDQDMRKEVFAQRREALRTSYQEARRAPHANSTRLTRHEKRELKRLEKALAQELCTLDRSHFDLKRVYAQVQHAEDNRFLRSFYFDEVNERSIHHFCRTYATDPTSRADVENGGAMWIERNALFLKNLESRAFRETVGELPPDDQRGAVLEARFEEHFFRWICQQAKSILADPEYQRLKQRDQASDVACQNGVVDPGMREVVAAWNAVPGVVVSSSCQGASGIITYAGKPLLVPSAHDECTTIVIVLEDEALGSVIEDRLSTFPLICLTQFSRPGGSYREPFRQHRQMRSYNVTSNAQVRQDEARAFREG